ncbi:hypothetical protein TRFO_36947 [Tritrichomonas foetus]|uniref:TPR Domain containing protein n=1 Tax=Tritrichomonas foetus TaxID=1144522 RepID=A0A1J4JHT3_9EUKA|nr:hypothetical protein TRFO_36947 [Tritrichomonas foetus]|eukprot:OHS96796.1 hypothetical protein TRFO_36947 [Tritrichomonas foetus]
MYYCGEGLTQSYTIAKEYFEKAIQVSPTFPNPYVFLGLIYKNGYGVEKIIRIIRKSIRFKFSKGNIQLCV